MPLLCSLYKSGEIWRTWIARRDCAGIWEKTFPPGAPSTEPDLDQQKSIVSCFATLATIPYYVTLRNGEKPNLAPDFRSSSKQITISQADGVRFVV
ncbi:hypothetical protein QLX08_010461 [Tetragonisca angustula]|uniref:Uncharacterized protein n=1 Tax=Tetragonisca angustula TaxID=166442 RepID=A0AAW0ZC25_9HYME